MDNAQGYTDTRTSDGRKILDRSAMFNYGHRNGLNGVDGIDEAGTWWMDSQPVDYNDVCEFYQGEPGWVADVRSWDRNTLDVYGECRRGARPQESGYAPTLECPSFAGLGWVLNEYPDHIHFQCGGTTARMAPGNQSQPCPPGMDTIDYGNGLRYCRPPGMPAADNTARPHAVPVGPGGSDHSWRTVAGAPPPTFDQFLAQQRPPAGSSPGGSLPVSGVQIPLDGCPAGQTLFHADGSRTCRTPLYGCPGSQTLVSSNGIASCVDTSGIAQSSIPYTTNPNGQAVPLGPVTGPAVIAAQQQQTAIPQLYQLPPTQTPVTLESVGNLIDLGEDFIPGVPNIALLAAAGIALFMFSKK